jgi:hypothetical protein
LPSTGFEGKWEARERAALAVAAMMMATGAIAIGRAWWKRRRDDAP